MKKPKLGFGEGGFKGFLARHVEKCILAVVILLMAFFIYSGSDTKPLGNANITQASLKNTAETARTNIQGSSWAKVAPARKPDALVIDEQRVDPAPYQSRVWNLPLYPRLSPRTDPRLFAPEQLVVTPLMGPLMIWPDDSEDMPTDPLDKFDVTVQGAGGMMGGSGMMGRGSMRSAPGGEPSESETKGRTPRNRSGRNSGPKSSMEAMAAAAGATTGRRRGRDNKDNPYGEAPGSSALESMGSMGSMGAMGAGASTERTITPEALMGVPGVQGAVVRPSYAMVINAVVPFSKQWEAYQEAFANAPGGQDPSRDLPQYIAVWVERADVTEDPAGEVPADAWKRLSTQSLRTLEATYAGEVGEISDPEALDPAITHPAPPFALTDLVQAVSHPEVPKADLTMEDEEFESERAEPEEGSPDLPDGLDSAEGSGMQGPGMGRMGGSRPSGAMRGGPGGPGLPGMSSPGGMGGGRMPRGGGPSAVMPRGSGSMGAMPRGGGPSAVMPRGSGSMGAMPRSGRGSMGMGAGMGAGMGMGSELNSKPVSKKQVRFVDFDVKVDRKYRYRIQLVLHDPNRPQDASFGPDMTSLDDKARERVKALDESDSKRSKELNRDYRTYWVTSPWSEASEVISLPSPNRFYAGENSPAGTTRVGTVVVTTTEPEAKVLAVQWDEKLGVFAPAERTTLRGATLNAKADVEVIHPIMNDLRKVPDYQLQTNALVLDMIGGEYLPGTDSKANERAPGETLIVDAEGNFIATDETTDVEGHRRYIFPEPEESSAAGSEEAGLGDAMAPPAGYPMGPGGPGGPGRQPKGARGRPMGSP
jgi:hypothetical protein